MSLSKSNAARKVDNRLDHIEHELHAALERGWALTPCAGKKCIREGWTKEPALDGDALLDYVRDGHNLALRTGSASGVIVLDLDGVPEPEWLESIETPCVQTGRGKHFYFRAPAGITIKNSTGELGPGMDVRGEGGCAVYPGSVHESGHVYHWLVSPDDAPLAALPAQLMPKEKLRPAPRPSVNGNGHANEKYLEAALQGELDKVRSAVNGKRNTTLNEAGFALGGLVHAGLDRARAENELVAAATDAGLPEHEVHGTVRSGMSAGERQPREVPEPKPAKGKRKKPKGKSESEPLRLAEDFLARRYLDADGRLTLRRWREGFYKYTFPAYEETEPERLKAEIYQHLDRTKVGIEVNRRSVGEVLAAIPACGCLVGGAAPQWLCSGDHPPADTLLPCRNGLLDIRTRTLLPPTPELFALHRLDYEFNPNAAPPAEWLRFLTAIWPDDAQSIETLQEWCGYTLTNATHHQKALLVVGPKRAGKGVIARVLTALNGTANVCSPTLSSLGMNFGLEALLDKRLAIVSDARLSARPDAAVITERLLSISGEDAITIDRKYKGTVTAKLAARFMVLTNEIPRLTDASGALASRFIVLRMIESFYGREDLRLTDRLLRELPGILNWAVDGWHRLAERGYFLQPESAREAIESLEELASPIRAFIDEVCIVGAGRNVHVDALYAAWCEWCEASGREHPGTKQTFGRDLKAAVPGVESKQFRASKGRDRRYEGIGLRAVTQCHA